MPKFNGETVVVDTLQSSCSTKHTCAWTPYNGKVCKAEYAHSASGTNGHDYHLYVDGKRLLPGHICHEVCLRLGEEKPGILDWPT